MVHDRIRAVPGCRWGALHRPRRYRDDQDAACDRGDRSEAPPTDGGS